MLTIQLTKKGPVIAAQFIRVYCIFTCSGSIFFNLSYTIMYHVIENHNNIYLFNIIFNYEQREDIIGCTMMIVFFYQ